MVSLQAIGGVIVSAQGSKNISGTSTPADTGSLRARVAEVWASGNLDFFSLLDVNKIRPGGSALALGTVGFFWGWGFRGPSLACSSASEVAREGLGLRLGASDPPTRSHVHNHICTE